MSARQLLWAGAALSFALGVGMYWDERLLTGKFVYDDRGTVVVNRMVDPAASSWVDLLHHDYWGEELLSNTSHKSFRPVVTATYRLHAMAQGGRRKDEQPKKELDPRPFHIGNAILHGTVAALVVPTAHLLLGGGGGGGGGYTGGEHSTIGLSRPHGAVVAGLAFALHPVHTEAVANVTGRAELLQALFYVLGFLAYTAALHCDCSGLGCCRALSLSLAFILCTLLSLFSKEPGVTLPLVCIAYDLIGVAKISPLALLRRPLALPRRSRAMRRALARTLVLGAFTGAVAAWRLSLNGGVAPSLAVVQNPAGFAKDPFVRFASVSWLYILNARLLLLPTFGAAELCCDWSADSIPLIESAADPRFGAVLAFYMALVLALCAMLRDGGGSGGGRLQRGQARCLLGAAFTVIPFALSANVFFPVGFVIAERVLYVCWLRLLRMRGR